MLDQHSLYYVERDAHPLGPFTQNEIVELHSQSALENNMTIKHADTGEIVPIDRLLPTPPPTFSNDPLPIASRNSAKPKEEERSDFVTTELSSVDIFDKTDRAYFGLFLIGFALFLDLRGLCLPRILYPIIGTVSSLIFLYNAYKFWSYGRLIADIPTSKARSAAIGLVEIHGKAVSIYELYSISCTKCIFYKYDIELLDEGKKNTISTSNYIAAPFYLEDASGTILVNPRDAQVGFSHSKRSQSTNWGRVIPCGDDLEYIEYLVIPGETLHIMGRVDIATRPDGTQYRVIKKGASDEPFLIFRENEARLLRRFQTDIRRSLLFGSITLGISFIILIVFLSHPFRPLVELLFPLRY